MPFVPTSRRLTFQTQPAHMERAFARGARRPYIGYGLSGQPPYGSWVQGTVNSAGVYVGNPGGAYTPTPAGQQSSVCGILGCGSVPDAYYTQGLAVARANNYSVPIQAAPGGNSAYVVYVNPDGTVGQVLWLEQLPAEPVVRRAELHHPRMGSILQRLHPAASRCLGRITSLNSA